MSLVLTPYPIRRSRRLRNSRWIRNLVSENHVTVSDLIWPIFVCDGHNKKEPISSLPNVYRYSIDQLAGLAIKAQEHGILIT